MIPGPKTIDMMEGAGAFCSISVTVLLSADIVVLKLTNCWPANAAIPPEPVSVFGSIDFENVNVIGVDGCTLMAPLGGSIERIRGRSASIVSEVVNVSATEPVFPAKSTT